MNSDFENRSQVSEAIAEARAMAREQVSAVWQMQLDQIRERIDNGWQESLDRIVAERFSELEQRLQRDLATVLRSSAKQLTEKLNGVARRLRQAGDREEAVRAVVDGAADFCAKAAVLTVSSAGLRLEGETNEHIPLASAPAFANAVESKDT